MRHEGIWYTPFELTFGKDPNVPSILVTRSSLKYEKYLKKAQEKIAIQKEKYKISQDSKIVLLRQRLHFIFLIFVLLQITFAII